MGTRDDGIPPKFVSLLLRLRPAMKKELVEDLHALAYFAWVSPAKSRKHSMLEDHMHITYQELEHRFGRGQFHALNSRLDIFDVTPNWWLDQGMTRGYKLKDDIGQAVAKYVKNWRRRMKSFTRTLVGMDGKQLKTIPQAIASKDTEGITAKAWNRAAVKKLVPVDVPRLVIYFKQLERMIDDRQSDLFFAGEIADYEYRRDVLGRIMDMARLEGGRWCVTQRYIESKSGRLYGKNINLQTVPGSIKQAALHGLWEYDFSNCHYSILHQLAARHGLACDAIAHYLANKKAVRRQIMVDAHLTEDQAKTCLIALIYGARFSVRDQDAIPTAIGIQAANRLYQHPLFIALKNDVTAARGQIISRWPRSRKALMNDYGKWINESEGRPQILAHLLQGVEAKMLEAVRGIYEAEILLLQHDGFASSVRLDTARMRRAIQKATSYQIEIEEERIQLSPDLGLGAA